MSLEDNFFAMRAWQTETETTNDASASSSYCLRGVRNFVLRCIARRRQCAAKDGHLFGMGLTYWRWSSRVHTKRLKDVLKVAHDKYNPETMKTSNCWKLVSFLYYSYIRSDEKDTTISKEIWPAAVEAGAARLLDIACRLRVLVGQNANDFELNLMSCTAAKHDDSEGVFELFQRLMPLPTSWDVEWEATKQAVEKYDTEEYKFDSLPEFGAYVPSYFFIKSGPKQGTIQQEQAETVTTPQIAVEGAAKPGAADADMVPLLLMLLDPKGMVPRQSPPDQYCFKGQAYSSDPQCNAKYAEAAQLMMPSARGGSSSDDDLDTKAKFFKCVNIVCNLALLCAIGFHIESDDFGRSFWKGAAATALCYIDDDKGRHEPVKTLMGKEWSIGHKYMDPIALLGFKPLAQSAFLQESEAEAEAEAVAADDRRLRQIRFLSSFLSHFVGNNQRELNDLYSKKKDDKEEEDEKEEDEKEEGEPADDADDAGVVGTCIRERMLVFDTLVDEMHLYDSECQYGRAAKMTMMHVLKRYFSNYTRARFGDSEEKADYSQEGLDPYGQTESADVCAVMSRIDCWRATDGKARYARCVKELWPFWSYVTSLGIKGESFTKQSNGTAKKPPGPRLPLWNPQQPGFTPTTVEETRPPGLSEEEGQKAEAEKAKTMGLGWCTYPCGQNPFESSMYPPYLHEVCK